MSLASEQEKKMKELNLRSVSDNRVLEICKNEIESLSKVLEENPWLKAKLDSEHSPPPTKPPPNISFVS